jgi:DNA modification methylase
MIQQPRLLEDGDTLPPRERDPAAANGTARTKHPRNTLNELTGDEWVFFTKSVLTTAYGSELGHALRKQHGANKPPQLMRELIEFFTPAGGRVLDPFAGVGGTLLGAATARPPRECAGIEINSEWAAVYERVLRESPNVRAYPLHVGDARTLLADATLFPDEGFDFICTDPPYNVHLEQTMSNDPRYAHANRRSDYNMRSDAPGDLANLASYDAYLDAMQEVLRGCQRVLKPGKYLALILRNAYQNGRYVFTHADVARRAELEGFVTKGEKVWYQAGTRLRPYGYPFAYIPNIAHQHIVFFQKPRTRAKR